MAVQHAPWIPTQTDGIDGERIAIIGYSHHRKPENPDTDDFTRKIVCDVINGRENLSFFSAISGYFDCEDDFFWRRVLFFNFLSNCIGTTEEKYKTGKPTDHESARRRTLEILRNNPVNKIFVFSWKAWSHFPDTEEEKAGRKCPLLFPDKSEGAQRPEIGMLTVADRHIPVCGLRHPQFANTEKMKEAVQKFRDRRLS